MVESFLHVPVGGIGRSQPYGCGSIPVGKDRNGLPRRSGRWTPDGLRPGKPPPETTKTSAIAPVFVAIRGRSWHLRMEDPRDVRRFIVRLPDSTVINVLRHRD